MIAAEDRSFWTNNGIDPKGILRAAFSNASGNSTQGASTITQQYVKILYLTQERSYKRKIKEAILVAEAPAHSCTQGRDPRRATSTPSTSVAAPTASRPPPRPSSARPRQEPQPARSRPRSRRAQLAEQLRPGQRPGREARRSRSRYHYVLDGMEELGNITAEPVPTRPHRKLPKFPKSAGRRARTSARTATSCRWSATSCTSSTSPTRRSTAAACGSPPRSTRRSWTPPRTAC